MSIRVRTKPPKGGSAYRQLWRIVDGAVADAFRNHPGYLVPRARRAAQNSVTKRVVGAVLGFAAQAAKGHGVTTVADSDVDLRTVSSRLGALTSERPVRSGYGTGQGACCKAGAQVSRAGSIA